MNRIHPLRMTKNLLILIVWLCSMELGLRSACAQNPKPDINAGSSAPNYTNSMEALDDKRKLGIGDRLSYRVIEERKEPVPLVVTDSGEVEVPLIGRMPAENKTCRQLAMDIKAPLEKEYFYKATVIISLDSASIKSRGRIYLSGQLRYQGPMELPMDESVFTVSRAVMKAGGFAEFANKRKVKIVRKKAPGSSETETFFVDVQEIIEQGHTEKDVALKPEDMIIVSKRMINF